MSFTPELIFGPYQSGIESGPPSYRTILGEDPSVTRLRELAAVGGQPAVMGSPPTVTLGVLNAGTAIPAAVSTYNWDSASMLRTAGEWELYGASFPDNLAGRGVSTTFLPVTSTIGYAYAVEFMFTGRYIEPRVITKGFNWQIFVDEAYVALPFIASGGGGYRCLVDFGAVVTGKKIRIEYQSDGQMALIEVLTESTATVSAVPAYADTLVVIGDSYCGQTGVTYFREMLSYMISRELGFSDYRIASSGGTGYVQDNPGVQVSGFDRWTPDVIEPNPLVAISLLGSNDINDGNDGLIQTGLADKLNALFAANSGCLTHIFSPINASAPGLPAGYAGLSTAIQAACAGKPRVWFHDISDVTFTKFDGVHPNPAGHVTLYKAIYNKIAATHGLHLVI